MLSWMLIMVMSISEPATLEMPHEVLWRPHPGPQTEMLRRSEDEVLAGGSRGGGKTDAGMAWMVRQPYICHSSYRGLVIRRNADDLSDWITRARTFYRPLHARFAGNPPVIKFPGGGIIKCGHLKDEHAFEKYLGHEYQLILIEELTLIPRESDYEKLISSCRSTVPELKPQIFATTNPGNAGHGWVKQRFVDVARLKTFFDSRTGQSRIFIPATMDDNPTLMLIDPGYVQRIEGIKDEKLRSAWRWGDWDTFSGQFFAELNPQVHFIKPFRLPEHWFRFRGLDWGYASPSAVPWLAIDEEGTHYQYREFYEAENVPEVLAEKVLNLTGKEQIISTPADPSIWARNQYGVGVNDEQATRKSIYDALTEKGLYCIKANNDRINGWARFRQLLYWDENHPPKYFIFENCVETIRTLPNLVHDEHNVEDLDTDGEDHLADGIRYVIMHTTAGQAPIAAKSATEQFIDKITVEKGSNNQPWDNF